MKILVDEKTGQRYEWKVAVGNYFIEYGSLTEVKEINPMPELEIGDWYKTEMEFLCVWRNDSQYVEKGLILEIRKANGTVWRKLKAKRKTCRMLR